MLKPNETRKLLHPSNGKNATQIEFIMDNAVRNAGILLADPGVPHHVSRQWALATLEAAAAKIAAL